MLKIISFLLVFGGISYGIQDESILAEQLYTKLFKRRRAEQLQAIKNFQKINTNYDKQYLMIMMMAEQAFTVIQTSRATIESSYFIPGISEFPSEIRVRDALSSILENTALFSEIILRFPDVSRAVLVTNNNWDVLLQWAIAFSNQVRYLLDSSTVKLLTLVSQELNHVPRQPNYVNPYREKKETPQRGEEEEEEAETVHKKKKKKKEIKKGPKFSSGGRSDEL